MIGIVGGVGPLAGLDVLTKIIEETKARSDHEHIPVVLSSQPQRIADRTAYLLGQTTQNPARGIVEIIRQLESIGATVVAIPCHAAHAPQIFNIILEELERVNSQVKILHMIQETVKFIKEHLSHTKIGVLSATGTGSIDHFASLFQQYDLTAITPSIELQERVQACIYDTTYGIKAVSSPVSNRARQELLTFITQLKKDGAQAVILGEVEFPLAIHDKESAGIPIIDPNRVLARALINAIEPDKLREI